MPIENLKPKGEEKIKEDICIFAQTNYRSQPVKFGTKTDDRRRHMYVIGKTGMGKTTMMENMVLHDIYKGHGVGVVDPHGDFAEKLVDFIPSSRINDVIYLNPSDIDFPIGFNILEVKSEEQKHLIASGLMGIFKKIWPDVWSARMEYILNNTLLALLDYPGSTLMGINRLLADKNYRRKVVKQLKDPVVKAFWQDEFANYEPRYAKEAVAPIQNKIGQFMSASVIRNMVAQVKSTIDIRELMDNKKILIMNLSKGRIGEDNSRLLGGMLITKIQLAAMERVDMPESERKDFFLYVDEFQNFATPSFANILSEARKYRLSLIMAHQYVAQLDEIVADAVFGNVGTIVSFRVGGADAEMLTKEFEPTFIETDIVNLAKYQILLKLMIDGVASQPFSALTLPPIGSATGSKEKVIRVSRERYGKSREMIEDKILRWSGMGPDVNDDEDVDTTIKSEVENKKNDGKKKEKKIEVGTNTEKKSEPIEKTKPEETVSLKDLLPPASEKSKDTETVGEDTLGLLGKDDEKTKETSSPKKFKKEIIDYFEKNADYIIKHKDGDHKYVFLPENKPKDVVLDNKGRRKGSIYEKAGVKIYDVKIDMYESANTEEIFGANKSPDIWVGSLDDALAQFQAIRSGKGGGTKFLGIKDNTNNPEILKEKIVGTGEKIITDSNDVIKPQNVQNSPSTEPSKKKRRRRRKKKSGAQNNNSPDRSPQNAESKEKKDVQNKTEDKPKHINQDEIVRFDN
ncbi:type IV secretion system DNA-binding domain-containing protein [Candidatus Parcubacteria bacterium]|nr:type IV secretion system DNA-binding domain-containing protein [Candidatus Parcubacteria bacterium]